MQVFPNGQKADFIKPKPIGHVFHSSPARTKFSLLTNTGFECFNNSDNPAKTSQALKLNVKGNGLPPEKSSESVEDETLTTTNNNIHNDNYDRPGPEFFKKSRGKQSKNIRNTLVRI